MRFKKLAKRYWVFGVLAIILVAGGLAVWARLQDDPILPGQSNAPASQQQADLLGRMRQGGLIMVIRHAETDQSNPDQDPVDFNDCSTQRNLTDGGRAEAREIGSAMRDYDIPIEEVWASPYCRTQETGRLVFGEQLRIVEGLEQLYPTRNQEVDLRLNGVVSSRAATLDTGNLAISTHAVYPSVLPAEGLLDEGEMAIYAPEGDGFVLLGRVAADEWTTLGVAASLPDEAWSVAESVVGIEVDNQVRGSGFHVALPGIIVTTAGVVGESREVTVLLPDGARRTAQVLGSSPGYDIAALRLETGLPPLHSGSGLANARTGDGVYAVGFSDAQRQVRIAAGTLRALDHTVERQGRQMRGLSAEVDPLSSYIGAPLVDAGGYVLGVLAERSLDGSTWHIIPVDDARREAMSIVDEA